MFRDLKRRGLNQPKLVVGDGALGAWAALCDAFPSAGEQRCWFHAAGNLIDCLPKRLPSRAKGLLGEIEIIRGPDPQGRRAGAGGLPAGVRRQVPQGAGQARPRLEAANRVL